MLFHFKNTLIDGPTYHVWWHLHLTPAEREKWDRYGAAFLTTSVIDYSMNNRLVAPIAPFLDPDELDALIDPDRGVTRTFTDARAARDYQDRVKREVEKGLIEYWLQAGGFVRDGEHWYPKRP